MISWYNNIGEVMLIVIPAYNPDYHLIKTLKSLKSKLNNNILVVNDGSDISKNDIFEEAKEYATVICHDVNKGKGRAMKTALQYIKDNNIDEDGVVFVDADGQHKAKDVKRMIDSFYENKDSLILGVRVFNSIHVPFKSKMGNKITIFIFRLFTHKYISDTQTGLRAISTKYIPFLLKVEGNRYEYEMNMLIDTVNKKINIVEVPIETVYEDKKNSTSHFKVFRDSYLIYKKFLKFALSSFSSSVVDYIAFLIFLSIFGSSTSMMFLSNILARLISGTVNYFINKKLIFKHKDKTNSALQYFLLATFIILLNSGILLLLAKIFKIVPAIAKIIVELTLFLLNYRIQHRLIFKEKEDVR